ncbi:MAG: peptide deformylase [Clostridiales bacterium]|mgnify:CR=1 FL=1|nr:peptide deformylase [Clostridiales bacterium]
MALRDIKHYQRDSILRKRSRRIDNIDDRVHTLLDDMIETMYAAEGVGLAAPQVGVLKRVIVIDIGEGLIEIINPEIVKKSGKQLESEGCLSVPGIVAKVSRPMQVTVKGLDRDAKEITVEGTGLMAAALCHEIDHLDGILFIDRADIVYEED